MLETLKKPLRYVRNRLRHIPTATNSSPPPILNAYSHAYPAEQSAVDIFGGEWASKFPDKVQLQAGQIPLFEDERIRLGLSELNGVKDQTVLELGPLEGGHSYQLEQAGARSILAIEANTRAYLKCLIAKEIMGMQRVQFLLGDFMLYLREQPPHFDFVLASGVLYHQKNPVELIHLLAGVTDRTLVWTHYYDEAIIQASSLLNVKFSHSMKSTFNGMMHTLYQQDYRQALNHAGFCGAGATYSHWLSRDELLAAFHHAGFRSVKVLQEDQHLIHGPCMLIAARK